MSFVGIDVSFIDEHILAFNGLYMIGDGLEKHASLKLQNENTKVAQKTLLWDKPKHKLKLKLIKMG